MSKPARRVNPDSVRTRRRFLVVGLAIFLVLDAVLIVLALNPRVPVSSDSAQSTQDPIADPQAGTTPEETQPPVPTVAPARILAAGDESFAWRATTGSCGAPALPELTIDAGVSWKATSATGATGVVSLQSIAIEGQQVASMIGQDSVDCSAMLVRTFVAGDNYAEYPADLDRAWFIDPLDHAVVHAAAGAAPGPCGNVLVIAARSDTEAAALCDDGSVYATVDGSTTWSPVQSGPGAMTIATTGEGYTVAAVGDSSCSGVQLSSFDASAPTSAATTVTGACIPNPAAPSALAGQIALSEGAGAMWLWAGDVTVRSLDGGSTWE